MATAPEKLLTLEQMQVLMLVAGSDCPQRTALEIRNRWRYMLGVAVAAQKGLMLDTSLPQATMQPEAFAGRAEAVLAVLDEWIADHNPNSVRLGEGMPAEEDGA